MSRDASVSTKPVNHSARLAAAILCGCGGGHVCLRGGYQVAPVGVATGQRCVPQSNEFAHCATPWVVGGVGLAAPEPGQALRSRLHPGAARVRSEPLAGCHAPGDHLGRFGLAVGDAGVPGCLHRTLATPGQPRAMGVFCASRPGRRCIADRIDHGAGPALPVPSPTLDQRPGRWSGADPVHPGCAPGVSDGRCAAGRDRAGCRLTLAGGRGLRAGPIGAWRWPDGGAQCGLPGHLPAPRPAGSGPAGLSSFLETIPPVCSADR